jgi:hypothetical protein
MSKLIIETVVKVDAETIEVTASTKVRELAVEKKVFYKGSDVASLITDYDIIEVLKDYTIANTKRANYSQRATWFFKIKKTTTRKTKPAKAKPAPKTEPTVEKPPAPPTKPTQTKASTKRSIRGRMSKIAKDKQGE